MHSGAVFFMSFQPFVVVGFFGAPQSAAKSCHQVQTHLTSETCRPSFDASLIPQNGSKTVGFFPQNLRFVGRGVGGIPLFLPFRPVQTVPPLCSGLGFSAHILRRYVHTCTHMYINGDLYTWDTNSCEHVEFIGTN